MAVAQSAVEAVSGPLWPEEAAYIAKAVDGRRGEFITGRILARRAIAMLGGEAVPIPPGSRGMPIWPAGYVGSISHVRGTVAAAVAKASDIGSIGIDIEEMERFRPTIEKKIARPDEIAVNFEGLPPDARQAALAIMFSAKEAFYKCQYPITGQIMGFHDAHVVIDDRTRTFQLSLLVDAPLLPGDGVFQGKYGLKAGTVYTAMVMANHG